MAKKDLGHVRAFNGGRRGKLAPSAAYVLSVIIVALATITRIAFDPFLGQQGTPYITFFLANALTMRYLGFGPSILAVVLGALCADWFFIPPLSTLELNWAHVVPFLLFLTANLLLLMLTQDMRRAQAKAEDNAKNLLGGQQMVQLRADIIQTLQRAAPMRDLLQSVTDLLVKGLDAAFARIWTLDSSGQVLELQASAGLYTHINGGHARVPVGQYKIGLIAHERRPHLTNQVIGDPRVHNQEWAQREGMVAFAGFPLLLEGQVLGVVALFARHELSPAVNDVLEAVAGILAQALARKKTEEELRRAKDDLAIINQSLEKMVQERTSKLEQALKSLQGVLYHVVHDLRAPLRAVHGFTEVLLRRYSPKFDSEGAQLAQRMLTATHNMDLLIHDLLSYGEMGHQQISMGIAGLDCSIEHVLRVLNTQITERHAKIQVDKPLPAVWADQKILQQILWNLLSNALKFVAPGVTPEVHIWAEKEGDYVLISIQDNGIGIPPEYQERVFGVFEVLNRPEEYPGTGMGLAIVRRGVELLEGEVQLHSRVGHGSRFTLKLKSASTMTAGMAA